MYSFEDTSAAATSFDHPVDPQLIDIARLEQDTWSLLANLYQYRSQPYTSSQSAQETVDQNPYTPTNVLIERISTSSTRISELTVVQAWLEGTAPPPVQPDLRPSYRVNAKRRLQQNQRTGRSGIQDVTNLVKELDPDAVTRTPGSALDPDDEAFERSLAKSVFTHIRAGRLLEAFDVCHQSNHPWLAAVMRGGLPFRWDAFGSSENATDMVDVQSNLASGNRRRGLWREMCIAATSNVGCLRSFPPLLPTADFSFCT